MNEQPDQNDSPKQHDSVTEISPALTLLETRFANRDGIGMLTERLGPEEIQWLGFWFHSTASEGGCGGGGFLEILAPIFDSRIDLWGKRHQALAPSSEAASHAMACSLFAYGLTSGTKMQDHPSGSGNIGELVEDLGTYNHADTAGHRMDQIDPNGFGTTWPMKLVSKLTRLYPSLKLTLNALRRIAHHEQRQAEPCPCQAEMTHAMEAPKNKELPTGLRIFFFAGAIAGGVLPGSASLPFPIPDEADEPDEVKPEKDQGAFSF